MSSILVIVFMTLQLEEREYTTRKWVCTKREAVDKGTHGENGMFWRLFNYISGENEPSLLTTLKNVLNRS